MPWLATVRSATLLAEFEIFFDTTTLAHLAFLNHIDAKPPAATPHYNHTFLGSCDENM